MYGFQAISEANGWAISLAGISIVFCGLVVLSTIIANVQRLLELWDNRANLFKPAKPVPEAAQSMAVGASTTIAESDEEEYPLLRLSPEQMEVANYFRLIAQRLGEPFSLQRLLDHAAGHGIVKYHSHLDHFLKVGLIEECEEEDRGLYRWNKDLDVRA